MRGSNVMKTSVEFELGKDESEDDELFLTTSKCNSDFILRSKQLMFMARTYHDKDCFRSEGTQLRKESEKLPFRPE